jgi:lysozyme family protein
MMTAISFDTAVNYVLANEGGLEIDPNDPGGATQYGISLRFLREVPQESLKRAGIFSPATEQTIRELTLDQAKLLYRAEFWDKIPFDRLMNQNIANYLFDTAVNCGLTPAVRCAQRACWAIMHDKDTLSDDGNLGDKTLDAINQCGFYLLPVLRAERAGYYRKLVASDPSRIDDLEGWLNRTYKA